MGGSVYLQNIYDFQRILAWQPEARREIARADLPLGVGPHFKAFYANLDGTLHGVRPSPNGPVYFAGDREFPIDPTRHQLDIARTDHAVEMALREGPTLIASARYVPDEREYDMYEDAHRGLFDWLAERMRDPRFVADFTETA